jgi:hypothetical protein
LSGTAVRQLVAILFLLSYPGNQELLFAPGRSSAQKVPHRNEWFCRVYGLNGVIAIYIVCSNICSKYSLDAVADKTISVAI